MNESKDRAALRAIANIDPLDERASDANKLGAALAIARNAIGTGWLEPCGSGVRGSNVLAPPSKPPQENDVLTLEELNHVEHEASESMLIRGVQSGCGNVHWFSGRVRDRVEEAADAFAKSARDGGWWNIVQRRPLVRHPDGQWVRVVEVIDVTKD